MADTFDLSRLGPPDWALDELADHIVDRHHRYVQGAIPALREALDLAVDRWGAAHPPVVAVRVIFEDLAVELEPHMAKEEYLLFPAIRELARARRERKAGGPTPFATILHPVRAMEAEHDRARHLLVDLRRETANYRPPDVADAAGRECYRQLARFDADLETHIHLENDILFPQAMDVERHVA
jgi:regulator of cell morphogenesis and NO signaling